MEDLPLGRIAALVPAFAVKDMSLGQNTDDDDDDYDYDGCGPSFPVICLMVEENPGKN